MKYVIKESRFDNVIDAFITFQLEPHKEYVYDDIVTTFWVKNDKIIVQISETGGDIFTHKEIFDLTQKMFSLSYIDTCTKLQDWFAKHHNLDGHVVTRANATIGSWEEIRF